MAEVQEELTAPKTGSKKKAREGKPVTFWLPVPEYEDLKVQADEKQMTLSDYVRARLRGTPTRDRSDMAAIAGLHVAGRSMMELAKKRCVASDQQREASRLIDEMRRLTAAIGERFV